MALSTLVTTASLHRWSKQYIEHQEGIRHSYLTTQPPPFQKAFQREQNPKIPSPNLFSLDAGSQALSKSHSSLPTVAECAVHLELLQAFQHFRIGIISSERLDRVLGIELNPRTVFRKVSNGYGQYEQQEIKLQDLTFDERRKTKWLLLLSLAAARFLKWVEVIEKDPAESILLPPIDILMIWHSLLLNPKWFQLLEYQKLSQTPFPWKEIHHAINSEKRDWPMELPSRSQFRLRTGLHPDLLDALVITVKSKSLKDLLKQHDSQTGINKANIDKILQEESTLNSSERLLIQHLQFALSDDPMIKDLVGAVIRQSAFVEKMDRQLWIRSPAVEGTLKRAIQRYDRFLKLFKMYPRKMLVPTMDIDITWHTHQCSPAQYMEATKTLAGRFIDHDDKLGSHKLNAGLENTINLYRVRFADEYEYCLCWDCEAVKSAVTSKSLGEKNDAKAIAKQVQFDVAYFRAVEIARREGQTLLPVQGEDELSLGPVDKHRNSDKKLIA